MTDEQQRIPALGQGRGVGLSLGAARGRGAGKGQPGSSSSSSLAAAKDDAAIRLTDNDAVGSRMAAIQHHYIKSDPYTSLLVDTTSSSAPIPRPPIINIGTFLRCQAIDNLVESFLEAEEGSPKQIISLGAGSDSRYWRLRADPTKKVKLRHYVELDFKQLTMSKIEKVVRHEVLLKEVSANDDDVRICEYYAFLITQRDVGTKATEIQLQIVHHYKASPTHYCLAIYEI